MLALLDRLRETVREFIAREQVLREDRERQAAATLRSLDGAAQREAARVSEAVARVRKGWDEERARCELRFAARERRIREAGQGSRRRALEAIDHEEGRVKYQLQKATLQAERQREAELANATVVWEEFQDRLKETRDLFLTLEYEAHRAFSGHGRFRQWILESKGPELGDVAGDENEVLAGMEGLRASLGNGLAQFRRYGLVRLFRWVPIWPLLAVLVLGHVAALFVLPQLGWNVMTYEDAVWSLGLLLVLVLSLYGLSQRQGAPVAARVAADLVRARQLLDACEGRATERRRLEQERAREGFAEAARVLDGQWQEAVAKAEEARTIRPREIDSKALRLAERNRLWHEARKERVEREGDEALKRIEREAEAGRRAMEAERATILTKQTVEFETRWAELVREWKVAIGPIHDAIDAANQAVAGLVRPWDDPSWGDWEPPLEFQNAVPFGRMEVKLEEWVGHRLTEGGLSWPGPMEFGVPLTLGLSAGRIGLI
jgi:hypothetical protein